MKIMSIIGTRPNIIKVSPIVREILHRKLDHVLVHTGQHYDAPLSNVLISQLKIPKIDHHLNVRSDTHGAQTGKMLIKMDKVIIQEQPDVVLVNGDTNTTLAGALSPVKFDIPVGHIEAGARYARETGLKQKIGSESVIGYTEPEQINRIIVDRISQFLFAATEDCVTNLLTEGLPKERIFLVGDVLVDAYYQNFKIAMKTSKVLKKYKLKKGEFALLTLHHLAPEDSVNRKLIGNIIEGLSDIFDTIFFPVHPRTKKILSKLKIKDKNLIVTPPMGYLDFLVLLSQAKMAITDSGGVQKEALMAKVPCVTMVPETEWPETVELGSNILTGWLPSKNKIKKCVNTMMDRDLSKVSNPFGDGKASKRILDIIEKGLN